MVESSKALDATIHEGVFQQVSLRSLLDRERFFLIIAVASDDPADSGRAENGVSWALFRRTLCLVSGNVKQPNLISSGFLHEAIGQQPLID